MSSLFVSFTSSPFDGQSIGYGIGDSYLLACRFSFLPLILFSSLEVIFPSFFAFAVSEILLFLLLFLLLLFTPALLLPDTEDALPCSGSMQ